MTISSFTLAAILLGFAVSWIPRVAPVVLVKYKGLPNLVVRFLKYLPVSILFALTLSSLMEERIGNFPMLKGLEVLAALPTFWVAFRTKNLLYAVVTGIACMAVLRFIF
ncbi:AzlD domain-containing protein [Streptococcus dentiloxodontae]